VTGAPRVVVPVTTPTAAEDGAAECAAVGVPPASDWTAPRLLGSMLKKAVACHRQHGIALIPARFGSAATVALCNRHNEEQMRVGRVGGGIAPSERLAVVHVLGEP
jgi:hypothetical protein